VSQPPLGRSRFFTCWSSFLLRKSLPGFGLLTFFRRRQKSCARSGFPSGVWTSLLVSRWVSLRARPSLRVTPWSRFCRPIFVCFVLDSIPAADFVVRLDRAPVFSLPPAQLISFCLRNEFCFSLPPSRYPVLTCSCCAKS
jgi:hypothetical protein